MYVAHLRVEADSDMGGVSGRGKRMSFKNLAQMEEYFEKQCHRVVNNRMHAITKLEMKQGHKVLFMQRFENGVRL